MIHKNTVNMIFIKTPDLIKGLLEDRVSEVVDLASGNIDNISSFRMGGESRNIFLTPANRPPRMFSTGQRKAITTSFVFNLQKHPAEKTNRPGLGIKKKI